MDLKALRELDTKGLHDRLAELREKARTVRFGLGNREVKNVREIRTFKHEIAHIMTVLSERRHAEASKK